MTVWVTSGERTFLMRTVKIGRVRDKMTEIREGLRAGELVVTDGALFISNQYASAGAP